MNRLAKARIDRGWKKTRLILELRRAAHPKGLPKDESLARRIAAWENQGAPVGEFYQGLLCTVYGLSPDQLGLDGPVTGSMPGGHPELTSRLEVTRLDGSLVELLGAQTQTLRMIDRRLGASKLFEQATAHVGQIDHLVRHSLPNLHRSRAADELGQAAALAGWQALDMGRLDEAWRLHEVAVSAGREGSDLASLSYAQAQQAYVLLDAERPADALGMVTSVGRNATKLPPVLRAWLFAAEAEVCAAMGDRDGALRQLDLAASVLPTADDAGLAYVMLDSAHLARWRGHCLARLGEPTAIEHLTDALADMGEGNYGRAEVGLRTDLAIAFKAQGDTTQSHQQARRAADLAGWTGSQRQRQRIRQLLGP